MKKKILLTGSNGFVGNIFKREFSQKYEIFEVDLPDYDISKNNFLFKNFEKIKFDSIIHLGAVSSPKESFENPEKYYQINLMGTLNLLEFAKNRQIPNFFFMSSLTVNGESNKIIDENSKINPRHIYASTKAAAENLCYVYSHKYNITTNILRPNLIIGVTKNPSDLISSTIKELKENNTYTVFGNGEHKRDWTHVKDVVALIDNLIFFEGNNYNVFCLGDNKYSVNYIFDKIKTYFPQCRRIEKPKNTSSFDLFCSNNKIDMLTKWKPKISIEDMIEESISVYAN